MSLHKYNNLRNKTDDIKSFRAKQLQSGRKCLGQYSTEDPKARSGRKQNAVPLYRFYCEDCKRETDWRFSWASRYCLSCKTEVPVK